jgi:hypothetical protein
VKEPVLDENAIRKYIFNLYKEMSSLPAYRKEETWAGAYDFNLQPLTKMETYERIKKYYHEPIKNVADVQYVYYKNTPFKVASYKDEHFTSSLVDGKIVWNIQYVGNNRIITGYEASIKKNESYSKRNELYYAFKDHDCPVFLAIIDPNGKVIKRYAPAVQRTNTVESITGRPGYKVHLLHTNSTDSILEELENMDKKDIQTESRKSFVEIFRLQVLLRQQTDIAVNPLEHVAFMIKKKENRKADFNILKINKDGVKEWKYKVDMYYVNKNKSAMYALTVDETNSAVILITYSKGKVRQFKINAKNLFEQADDIVGFKPLVSGKNLNLKVYYTDKKYTRVHTVTYRTKEEQLKYSYPMSGSFYDEQIEQDLLAEKDGFQVYAVRNWGYSPFLKDTKKIPPISYFIVDNNVLNFTVKSELIPKMLKNLETGTFYESDIQKTLFDMSSRVYIGQKHFYIYEENVADKYSQNILTIYDKSSGHPLRIIKKGVTVMPNQGLPLSRYIYTFKSMLKKDNIEFSVIDSETLEKKQYILPGFKRLFSADDNIKLTPYLLRNLHVKMDKNGNIIIYRQTNKAIGYEELTGIQFHGAYAAFYVPHYQVYYIITKNRIYSFNDRDSKNNHLVLSDLNILYDELYLQEEKQEKEEMER